MTGFGLSLVCSVTVYTAGDNISMSWGTRQLKALCRNRKETGICNHRQEVRSEFLCLSDHFTGPWVACECFGSWILGIGVTGQTVWPLVELLERLWYFWILIYYDSWSLVGEALDVFVGFPGSVRTRQRCLCPGAFQGGGIRRTWRYGRGRGETARLRMITMSCTWTLFKFRVKICLSFVWLLHVVTYYYDGPLKHGASQPPNWSSFCTERAGLVWFASHVCNVDCGYWVNWDAQIISGYRIIVCKKSSIELRICGRIKLMTKYF